jgi:cytochrome P450
MMEHPDVLTKARKEIDGVVGTERLPSFNDREYLPYGRKLYPHSQTLDDQLYIAVDAVLSEIWRWAAPLPLSMFHKILKSVVACLLPIGLYNPPFIGK